MCLQSVDVFLCTRQTIQQVGCKKRRNTAQTSDTSQITTARRQSARLSRLAPVSMAESGDEGSQSEYKSEDEYSAEDEPENLPKVRFRVIFHQLHCT